VLIGQLRSHPLIEQLRTQPLDVAGARENFEQFDLCSAKLFGWRPMNSHGEVFLHPVRSGLKRRGRP
jgi:hypothetical protein